MLKLSEDEKKVVVEFAKGKIYFEKILRILLKFLRVACKNQVLFIEIIKKTLFFHFFFSGDKEEDDDDHNKTWSSYVYRWTNIS